MTVSTPLPFLVHKGLILWSKWQGVWMAKSSGTPFTRGHFWGPFWWSIKVLVKRQMLTSRAVFRLCRLPTKTESTSTAVKNKSSQNNPFCETVTNSLYFVILWSLWPCFEGFGTAYCLCHYYLSFAFLMIKVLHSKLFNGKNYEVYLILFYTAAAVFWQSSKCCR